MRKNKSHKKEKKIILEYKKLVRGKNLAKNGMKIWKLYCIVMY